MSTTKQTAPGNAPRPIAESDVTNLAADLAEIETDLGELGTDISAETARAITAESTLTTDVSTVTSDLATETARALAAEALLAPKASPVLTGVPTTPNATALTSNTQIANTKYVDDAVSVAEAGITSSGAAPPRGTISKTTASLAVNARETGSVVMAKVFQLQRVTADRALRLRLYQTAAKRDADTARPNTIPPTPGTAHGVICDLYLDGINAALDFWLAPLALGYNGDTGQSTSIYYTITNLSTSTHTCQVVLYFAALQS